MEMVDSSLPEERFFSVTRALGQSVWMRFASMVKMVPERRVVPAKVHGESASKRKRKQKNFWHIKELERDRRKKPEHSIQIMLQQCNAES